MSKEVTIKHTYKLKRGKEEALIALNPMLLDGEPIVSFMEDGSVNMKVGDGLHTYNELDWIKGDDTPTIPFINLGRINIDEFNEIMDTLQPINCIGIASIANINTEMYFEQWVNEPGEFEDLMNVTQFKKKLSVTNNSTKIRDSVSILNSYGDVSSGVTHRWTEWKPTTIDITDIGNHFDSTKLDDVLDQLGNNQVIDLGEFTSPSALSGYDWKNNTFYRFYLNADLYTGNFSGQCIGYASYIEDFGGCYKLYFHNYDIGTSFSCTLKHGNNIALLSSLATNPLTGQSNVTVNQRLTTYEEQLNQRTFYSIEDLQSFFENSSIVTGSVFIASYHQGFEHNQYGYKLLDSPYICVRGVSNYNDEDVVKYISINSGITGEFNLDSDNLTHHIIFNPNEKQNSTIDNKANYFNGRTVEDALQELHDSEYVQIDNNEELFCFLHRCELNRIYSIYIPNDYTNTTAATFDFTPSITYGYYTFTKTVGGGGGVLEYTIYMHNLSTSNQYKLVYKTNEDEEITSYSFNRINKYTFNTLDSLLDLVKKLPIETPISVTNNDVFNKDGVTFFKGNYTLYILNCEIVNNSETYGFSLTLENTPAVISVHLVRQNSSYIVESIRYDVLRDKQDKNIDDPNNPFYNKSITESLNLLNNADIVDLGTITSDSAFVGAANYSVDKLYRFKYVDMGEPQLYIAYCRYNGTSMELNATNIRAQDVIIIDTVTGKVTTAITSAYTVPYKDYSTGANKTGTRDTIIKNLSEENYQQKTDINNMNTGLSELTKFKPISTLTELKTYLTEEYNKHQGTKPVYVDFYNYYNDTLHTTPFVTKCVGTVFSEGGSRSYKCIDITNQNSIYFIGYQSAICDKAKDINHYTVNNIVDFRSFCGCRSTGDVCVVTFNTDSTKGTYILCIDTENDKAYGMNIDGTEQILITSLTGSSPVKHISYIATTNSSTNSL